MSKKPQTAQIPQQGAALLQENRRLKKRVQELERSLLKTEEAARARSELMANLSHEIRTPLNAILGITDLVLSDFDTGNVKANVERIKDAGLTLYELINDVLDYSRLQARLPDHGPLDFSPRELLSHTAAQHTFQARRKGLELQLELDPKLPDIAHGHSIFLRQILNNLLANAVKFTKTGGITVRADLETDAGREWPVHLLIAVRDTGIGIAPEHHERIFGSFVQADDRISQQFGGTGLGLAICRQLLDHMDGQISVLSALGQGATFLVSVPLHEPTDPMSNCTREMQSNLPDHILSLRTPRLSPLDILVVEDNELNQDLLRIFFTGRNHRVTCVGNGKAALTVLREKRFDVVFMDIQMPHMDGLEVTRRLRNAKEFTCPANVPVIALTAHAVSGDRERFLEAGLDEYVPKPVDFEELVAVMLTLLPHKALQTVHSSVFPEESSDSAGVRMPQPSSELGNPDRSEALALMGGNPALMARLDAVFIADAPADVEELAIAVRDGEYTEARRLAHKLKGAATTLGLKSVALLALELEKRCSGPVCAEDIHELLSELRTVVFDVLRKMPEEQRVNH